MNSAKRRFQLTSSHELKRASLGYKTKHASDR